MESACQPEAKSKQPKEEFAKNTRDMFMPCLAYASSIHLAWAKECPNHERISQQSLAIMQSTRYDLTDLQSTELDPAAQMVCLILDVVTDMSHFHLVKQAEDESAEGESALHAPHAPQSAEGESAGCSSISTNKYGIEVAEVACQAGEGMGEHSKGEGVGEHSVSTKQFGKRAALACMADDDSSGHIVSSEEVASLAAELASRRHKDPVPLPFIAAAIASLTQRCASLGQMLHVLLLGCNTIQLVHHLKQKIPEAEQSRVWLLCTSEVWPSDCSSMLWHLYGALARPDDMHSFRAGTRTLLGEYTDHYMRQSILDESRAELKLSGSLANAVHCDRLDRVVIVPGQGVQMELL